MNSDIITLIMSISSILVTYHSITIGFCITALTYIGANKELDIFKEFIVRNNKKYKTIYQIFLFLNISLIILSIFLPIFSYYKNELLIVTNIFLLIILEIITLIMFLKIIDFTLKFVFSSGKSSIEDIKK